jgi:hypothetical protein
VLQDAKENPTTLDLIITNLSSQIPHIEILKVISDHNTELFGLTWFYGV